MAFSEHKATPKKIVHKIFKAQKCSKILLMTMGRGGNFTTWVQNILTASGSTPPAEPSDNVGNDGMSRISLALHDSYITQEFNG